MTEEPGGDIRTTSRGRWERIGSWLLVFPGVPVLPLTEVLADLGLALWERLGVALLVFDAGRLHLRTFHFQAQVDCLEVVPGGRLKVFPDASMTDEPETNVPGRLPASRRRWRSVFLDTDGGLLQVAVPPAALAVFERELRAARHPAPENRD